ncbi:MAG: hypothetical protein Q9227_004756 [Pyrenula ochraceoflavens]
MTAAIPISRLSPGLYEHEEQHIAAIVTLLWPYSSSHRTFSLLLAEDDFRLRNSKGQVRVHFLGPTAKALAETRVGIGDRVKLDLRGCKFVQNVEDVSTPGKRLEWDLQYDKTLHAEVIQGRDSPTIVDVHASQTTSIESANNYENTPNLVRPSNGIFSALAGVVPDLIASPAFLRGKRISSGPFANIIPDPFAEEDGFVSGKGRKRTKLARDSHSWVYNARTPSPERELTDYDSALGTGEEEREDQESEADSIIPVSSAVEIIDDEGVETAAPEGGRSKEGSPVPSQIEPPIKESTPRPMGPPPLYAKDQVAPRTPDRALTPRLAPLASPGLPLVSPLVGHSGSFPGSYFPENIAVESELDASAEAVDTTIEPYEDPASPSPGSQQGNGMAKNLSDNQDLLMVDPENDEIVEAVAHFQGEEYLGSELGRSEANSLQDQASSSNGSNQLVELEELKPCTDIFTSTQAPGQRYEYHELHGGNGPEIEQRFPDSSHSFPSEQAELRGNELIQQGLGQDTQSNLLEDGHGLEDVNPLIVSDRHVDRSTIDPASEDAINRLGVQVYDQTKASEIEHEMATPWQQSLGVAHYMPDSQPSGQRYASDIVPDSPATVPLKTLGWQEKLDVKAVECKEIEQQLSPPPFPFVQNWDLVGNQISSQRRRSFPYKSNKRPMQNLYGGDGPISEPDLERGDGAIDLHAAESGRAIASEEIENSSEVDSSAHFLRTDAVEAAGHTTDQESQQSEESTTSVETGSEDEDLKQTSSTIGLQTGSDGMLLTESGPEYSSTLREAQLEKLPVPLGIMTPKNSQAAALEPSMAPATVSKDPALLTPQHTQSSLGLREIADEAGDQSAEDAEETAPEESTPSTRRSARLSRRQPAVDSQHDRVLRTNREERGHVYQAESNLALSKKEESQEPDDDTISVKPLQKSKLSLSKGLRTSYAYFTTLASLSSYFNQHVDVLVVATSRSTTVKRAPSGPRDYYTTLHITDPSTPISNTSVNIFRPIKTALPALEKGEAILLRDFKVQSRKGAMELLSTESSAWVVFHPLSSNGQVDSGAKEPFTIAGPPVEFGDAESERCEDLMTWFESEVQLHPASPLDSGPRLTRSRAKSLERDTKLPDTIESGQEDSNEIAKSLPQHGTAKKGRAHASPDVPLQHQLRDGTKYFDPTPRSPVPTLHELRDGTKWFDLTEGTSRPGSRSSAADH